jgi:glutamate racemase
MQIIDSAAATAQAVAEALPWPIVPVEGLQPELLFYATDSIEKFQRLGSSFLNQPLAQVRLVDLGG